MTQERAGMRLDRRAASLSYTLLGEAESISHDMVAWLKARVAEEVADSARICLHPTPDDPFHQMVIVQRLGMYCRPHRHDSKAEGCSIIEGELAFITFQENGDVRCCTHLGAGRGIIARASVGIHHMVIPLSPICVYHESKPGPYAATGDSLFPAWAPANDDLEGRYRYMSNLIERLSLPVELSTP